MSLLLLATDFSARSDRALRRAVLLAKLGNHDLRIVAVLEEGRTDQHSLDRDRAATLLDEIASSLAQVDGLPCTCELRVGHAPEELALAARESGASMIIIGPHRNSLIRDAFGTITSERIVQRSPVPVLAANGVPSAAYGDILFPVAFDENSRNTLDAARALGIAGTAGLTLLHVFDPEAREMMSRAMMLADERREYIAACAAEAEADLREFARSCGMNEARLLVEETSGLMAADVGRVASRFGHDLIVLSASEKNLIAKTLLGSVTADLLRSGESDILVVPVPTASEGGG